MGVCIATAGDLEPEDALAFLSGGSNGVVKFAYLSPVADRASFLEGCCRRGLALGLRGFGGCCRRGLALGLRCFVSSDWALTSRTVGRNSFAEDAVGGFKSGCHFHFCSGGSSNDIQMKRTWQIDMHVTAT